MARQKEVSRVAGGRTVYQNDPDSFVFRTSMDAEPELFRDLHASLGARCTPNTSCAAGTRGLRDVLQITVRRKIVQAVIPTVFEMAGTVEAAVSAGGLSDEETSLIRTTSSCADGREFAGNLADRTETYTPHEQAESTTNGSIVLQTRSLRIFTA